MISHGCFYGCNSLSTITFESDSKLSWICLTAFSGCSSLSSIYIPSSLQQILREYRSLLKIIVPEAKLGKGSRLPPLKQTTQKPATVRRAFPRGRPSRR
jgi:hypothetical protein